MATSDAQALLLQVSADVSKLQKQFDKAVGVVNTGSLTMERRAKQAATTMESAFGRIDVSKALDKVFDSSKLAVLDTGASKLRVFGSALEPLGPLGLGAAAGIVALGAALNEAHKAVEFADSIYKLAKNAHVTTDELQGMQFALRLAGGEAEKAAPGLESFSEVLGKASAGLPRALRGFQELFGKGFTAQDVKNLGDAGQALDTVTEKIAQLKNPAQKDAVIAQLGLTDLKPLIEGGVDAMREFRAEAEASGNIMDAHLVRRGHELNEEIETATGKIKVQLAEAFVNLGPILVKLLGILAQMAEFAEHVAAALSPLEARGTTDLQREQRAFQARQSSGGIDALLHRGSDQSHLSRIQAELDRRKASGEDKPPALPSGGAELADLSKTKAGRSDQTDSLTKAAEEDLQHALHSLAETYKALTDNVDTRAKFEIEANDAAAAAEQAKLKADLQKLLKDQTIDGKTSDILQAKIEQAQADVELARIARNQLVARNAAFAIEDRQIAVYQAMAEAQIAELQAQADIATTAEARNAVERRILALRQQLESDLRGTQIDRRVKTGDISPEQGAAEKAALGITQAAARSQQASAQLNPIQRYIKSVQDLNTVFENAAVTAAHDLSTGLADAIVNAKSLGDVASSVFRQLIAQLLSAAIEKDVAGPVLAFLGLADGGRVSGPGTATSDSIPALLSNGEYVINAQAAAKHAQLLDAINTGRLSHFAAGGPVPSLGATFNSLHAISIPRREIAVAVIQPFHFHAEGAVLTTDILDQADRQSKRNAVAAAEWARRTARKDVANGEYSRGLNG